MTFHEYKARLLEFLQNLEEVQAFQSDAQREYILARIEDAANIEALEEARREVVKVAENVIKDEKWISEQLPKAEEIELDEVKVEIARHESLRKSGASGNLRLYSRLTDSGTTEAQLDGNENEIVLTETTEGTETIVSKYRLSTTALIELIKKNGVRG